MELTFEQAYKRLQQINEIISSQDIVDIDKIISMQQESKILYDFCNSKLKTVQINISSSDND